MTTYFRKRVSAVTSNSSDYSNSRQPVATEYASSTVAKILDTTVSAATGGTTVELGNFSGIQSVTIYNTDSTNYVEAVWVYTNAAASDTTNKQKIVAGGTLSFDGTVKLAGDLVLTADTAACSCMVFIVGT